MNEWSQVVKGKKAPAPSPMVRYVRAEGPEDRQDDRCTENHPECMLGPERLCVYKIRKRIDCIMETRAAAACPYGQACYFGHPRTAEKCSGT